MKALAPFFSKVKRKAQGKIPYPYLVPAGPYKESWDWDGFFIGLALTRRRRQDAVYLQYWVRNYLANSHSDGFTPAVLTPEGKDPRLHHMKPYLAQGALIASTALKDFDWLNELYPKLKLAVEYRRNKLWNKKYDLGYWYEIMDSGADNNPAGLDHKPNTIIGADLNSLLTIEFKQLAQIASKLNKHADAKRFKTLAITLKQTIQKQLWNDKRGLFCNLDLTTGEKLCRVSFSTLVPLWAGIPTRKQAANLIERHILNPHRLWSKYGVRSLAKSDPAYNNRHMQKKNSNWQGPIWIVVNYITAQGLKRYGYQREAEQIAQRIEKILSKDIKTTGGMHENYNAETGKGIAAQGFIGWNLLAGTHSWSGLS